MAVRSYIHTYICTYAPKYLHTLHYPFTQFYAPTIYLFIHTYNTYVYGSVYAFISIFITTTNTSTLICPSSTLQQRPVAANVI